MSRSVMYGSLCLLKEIHKKKKKSLTLSHWVKSFVWVSHHFDSPSLFLFLSRITFHLFSPFKTMSVLIVPRKKKKQKSPRLPQILFQAEKFHFPLFASKFDHASSLCIYLSVWLLQSTANIYRDVQRGRSHCRLSSFERLDNVWPNVFTFKG